MNPTQTLGALVGEHPSIEDTLEALHKLTAEIGAPQKPLKMTRKQFEALKASAARRGIPAYNNTEEMTNHIGGYRIEIIE